MATNPRIDELRKRIDKDPGSRLFAQLAEELRKDGELEDAIRVAREGLKSHPNYPSARMTLGRALLDTGDWASARTEFELVLKGAADNILASRYLAECLENLGERDAAIARYKSTLAMAPGEKHVIARLQELEGGGAKAVAPETKAPAARTAPSSAQSARPMSALRPGSSTVPPIAAAPVHAPAPIPAPALNSSPPPPESTPAPEAPVAPPAPIPLSAVEGEMELETGSGAPIPSAPAPASPASAAAPMSPIPLVDADEDFELERPYESPTTSVGATGPAGPPAPVPAAVPEAEDEFELEAPHEAPATNWSATIRPLPVMDDPPPAFTPKPPPAPAAPQPMPPTPATPSPSSIAAGGPMTPVAAAAETAAGTAAAPPVSAPAPAPPASPTAPTAPAAAAPSSLISPTLGELYFNQGFTEKAIEVYRQLAAREPGNERLSARLRELEKLRGALGGTDTAPESESIAPAATSAESAGPPSETPASDRREAIERTIARLEGLLSAIRKG